MKKTNNKRRKFLKKSIQSIAAVSTISLANCQKDADQNVQKGPYINFNNTYRWKMTTTWSPNFPILGEGCNELTE